MGFITAETGKKLQYVSPDPYPEVVNFSKSIEIYENINFGLLKTCQLIHSFIGTNGFGTAQRTNQENLIKLLDRYLGKLLNTSLMLVKCKRYLNTKYACCLNL